VIELLGRGGANPREDLLAERVFDLDLCAVAGDLLAVDQ
jgi:hypothetical protein